jgi:hypothetical protein
MTSALPSSPDSLSDRDLLAEVARAAARERCATAHLVRLLMELDARRLYLGEGFSSLFTYCTQALHLAEHAAYNRIEAARAARRFPIVLELLDEGTVTLTAVRLLAPHLTPENHREVLAGVRYKSKREVEAIVAGLYPRPDVPTVIRKLPTPPVKPKSGPATRDARPSLDVAAASSDEPRTIAAPREGPPAELKPLAPERYKIQCTVSRETYEKLRRAQDLLRHIVPNGDPAIVLDRALTVLVTELERTKIGATDRPRPRRPAVPGTRHVPATVKRAVWQRDGGRCAFIGALGRCSETGFLEYHHVVPFAEGGETSVSNLALRCRAHNGHEAREYFGPGAGIALTREPAMSRSLELAPERVCDNNFGSPL